MGWSTSIVLAIFGAIIPPGETKEVVTSQVLTTDIVVLPRNTEGVQPGHVQTVLLDRYSFGEQGERVKQLQTVIQTVKVDGDYGPITRREHIKKLESMGLSTENVPAISNIAAYGSVKDGTEWNIPRDQSKRCPMWEQLFDDVGLEPVEVFSYVAWRESGCNPGAQNATWDKNGNMTYALNKDKSYDTGLLQINSSWRSRVAEVCGKEAIENRMEGLKNIHCNVKFAKWIMDNSEGKLSNWRIYKNK